jgi:tetratricopeptide (TPR) repeat protein
MSTPPTDPAFRILLIVSRPLDLPDLPHLGDQWSLINGLKAVNAHAYLKIIRPPTIEQLRTEILAGYHIVHFDGHGDFGICCPSCGMLYDKSTTKCDRCLASLEGLTEGGYLAFEREDGALDSLSAQDLAEIIAYPDYSTKLVILSACNSAAGDGNSILQTLVNKRIPTVIGMKDVIPAKATQSFFAPFYGALGKGMPISNAFNTALPALKHFDEASKLNEIPELGGAKKDAKIVKGKFAGGKVSKEPDLLHGLPDYDFIGDYIRGDPPRGRKGYLARLIKAFLENERLIVLTGPGGIGKTVIASETAKRIAYRFPGGVFWRSAKDVEHFGLNELLDAFAYVYGDDFRKQTPEAKRDQVLSYLRDYSTASLLVVDNAELINDDHLWNFINTVPLPSSVLVTTREGLAYGGLEIRVDKMEEDESLRLFKAEAGKKPGKWKRIVENKAELSPEESRELNEILRLLKGHPLGLKIAASMSANISLHAILENLKKHPPGEVSGKFDFSYNLLSDAEKDLLQKMSIFAGSFSPESVQAICNSEASQSEDCFETIGQLVRKSFVEKIGDENIRYQLHPLMRQYAASKIDIEKTRELKIKAARFFLDYATKFKTDFKSLDLERENILAGMDWAAEQMKSSDNSKDSAQMVSEYMWALDDYLDLSGYWGEYRTALNQAVQAAALLEDEGSLTGWVHNLAILEHNIGNIDEARKYYQQSMEIAQKLGDQSGISASLLHQGNLAMDTGNIEEARKYYQQSLEIAQKLGDQSGMSKCLHGLGNLAKDTGNIEEARKYYQQSLEIAQELGNHSDASKIFHQLGILAQNTGNYDEARKYYQQSLEIKQKLGNQSGISTSLHQLGNLAYLTGNYDEARKYYQQSLEIDQKLGDQSGISISLHQLGMLAQDQGNYDEARKYYQQSLEIKQKLGDQSGISNSLHQLGMLAQDTGNYDEARKYYQQSLEIFRKLGDQSGISNSLHQLGILAQDTGNYDEARKYYQQSLEIKQKLGDQRGYALSLAQMALLEEVLGNIPKAIELTQEAESIFIEIGASQYIEQAREQRERLEGK